MKSKLKFTQKSITALFFVGGTIIFLWLAVLGKIKAQQLFSPFFSKIPKSSEELKKSGKNVLGTAEEAATSQNAQKVLETGAKFFESSSFTEPIRNLRENVLEKVNETIETLKELPGREVRTIKREVCKQWLEEESPTATASPTP